MKNPQTPDTVSNATATDTPMWNDPSEPAYVRELLHAGRTEPLGYDVAQGLARHLANVQAGAPLPDWAQAAASAAGAGSSAWLSWLVLPVVAATAATGLWFATHAKHPAVVQSAPVVVAVAAPQPSAVAAPAPAVADVPAAPAIATTPAHSAASGLFAKQNRPAHKLARSADGPDSASAKQLDTTAGSKANMDATDRLMSAPIASHSVDHASAPVAAETKTAAHEETSAVAAPAQKTGTVSESRLEREMQMLAVAQRVLSSDPERALRLAQQGEREFPRTMFSAERQQLGLLAMVKLGRIDEARRIGAPFLAKYPNAPWSARLRRALATGRAD